MFRYLPLLALLLAAAPAVAQVTPSDPPYTIQTLKSRLTIEPAGSLLVEEGIEVIVHETRFSFDWRIPLTDADGRPLRVEILSVNASHLWSSGGPGVEIPYRVAVRGPWAELTIGDPRSFAPASSVRHCRVRYRVWGAIRRGRDEDQLRWLIGKWPVPIHVAEPAEWWVTPPPGVESHELRWFLERDLPGRDARPVEVVHEPSEGAVRLCVRIDRPVPANGFVALRLRWKTGHLQPPPLLGRWHVWAGWSPLLVALCLPLLMFGVWSERRGRLARRLERALEREPGEAPPAVCAAVLAQRVGPRALAAATLHLAREGHLHLACTADGALLMSRGAAASGAEADLVDALCDRGATPLSASRQRLRAAELPARFTRALAEQGWLAFVHSPRGAAWAVVLLQCAATFGLVAMLALAPASDALRQLWLTGAAALVAGAVALLASERVLRLVAASAGVVALASLGAQTEALQLRATLPLAACFGAGGAMAAALAALVLARPAYECCGPRGGAALARVARWLDAADRGGDDLASTAAHAVAIDRLPSWLASMRAADRIPYARGVAISAGGAAAGAQLRAVEAALLDMFTSIES